MFSQFFINISCKCCQHLQESNGKSVKGQRVLLFRIYYPSETKRRLHCCCDLHIEKVVKNQVGELLLECGNNKSYTKCSSQLEGGVSSSMFYSTNFQAELHLVIPLTFQKNLGQSFVGVDLFIDKACWECPLRYFFQHRALHDRGLKIGESLCVIEEKQLRLLCSLERSSEEFVSNVLSMCCVQLLSAMQESPLPCQVWLHLGVLHLWSLHMFLIHLERGHLQSQRKQFPKSQNC